MARSVKPGLLFIFYCLNFAIITCLLTAAFFLAQGLFGDLYACNAVSPARTYLSASQALML